jgi:hypothetical protein
MDCFAPLAMTVMERTYIAAAIARSGSDEAIHGGPADAERWIASLRSQ